MISDNFQRCLRLNERDEYKILYRRDSEAIIVK